MKLYDVTFNTKSGLQMSLPSVATSRANAKKNIRILLSHLNPNQKFYNFAANVVVFGVDGKGKSLNKLKNDN